MKPTVIGCSLPCEMYFMRCEAKCVFYLHINLASCWEALNPSKWVDVIRAVAKVKHRKAVVQCCWNWNSKERQSVQHRQGWDQEKEIQETGDLKQGRFDLSPEISEHTRPMEQLVPWYFNHQTMRKMLVISAVKYKKDLFYIWLMCVASGNIWCPTCPPL